MSAETIPHIRVVHSIVDNKHLAELLRDRYTLSPGVYCELIHRGMNDIYKVTDGASRLACRVWRTAWRSLDDVAYEMSFLAHLHGKGIAVANGVPALDGSLSFVVQAPEGIRSVALFEWAPGRPFGDQPNDQPKEQHAFEIGALFAQMHGAGADFKPDKIRRTNAPSDYLDNLPYLKQLVMDRPGDMALYQTVAENLHARVKALEWQGLPFGPCHGDFHFNNVHINDDNGITLLDFDNSGEDYLLQDVACYLWGNYYGKLEEAYGTRFIDGYTSVRPFTADEEPLLGLFIMAKEFRLISGFAKNVNQIGHFPLRFRNLAWFEQSIRARAESLDLI